MTVEVSLMGSDGEYVVFTVSQDIAIIAATAWVRERQMVTPVRYDDGSLITWIGKVGA